MDANLIRIIDANYPNYEQNNVEEALTIVGDIVQQTSNVAVYRNQFNKMTQIKDELFKEYYTRLKICALDCNFVSPFDATYNLTMYY